VDAQAPFWLEGDHDWDPDDLLVFHNCILNVGHHIKGYGESTIPRTPSLFYKHQIHFDFDPQAREPVEWFRFLDSLEQPSDWHAFLQQIMGYCLWRKYDLQKFFVFVGPRRSGKGTIAHVMTHLLGGESAVCSPDLDHFASEFGMEQAIGKRLAIVPEIRLPDRNRHQIVARLKAITGGDLVTVNRKHVHALPLRLKMKIIMVTNNFVALPDNAGALQARMLPLKLTKSFFGKEDFKLQEKLKPEYPGILVWALEGLRKLWESDGQFALPQSTQEELDQLMTESAPLQAFIAQCCEVNLNKGVQSKALFQIDQEWMRSASSNAETLSDSQFANELRSAVHSITKDRASKPNQREYKGRQIVGTEFDDLTVRAGLRLGICPKMEWRSRRAFR